MMQPQSMRDVIVIIPGILGSVLVKDGREVWGASAKSAIGNLLTFGRALNQLKLESGIGHEDPKDGVSAPRFLPRLHMIPTFWKADGYGRLVERLFNRFSLISATHNRPGNLVEFPYDWRLSNQLNAQRLADTVVVHLDRWQRHTQNRGAKLILICHSMGGLIARWFLERLGGRDVTRILITISTPYRGSVNALNALVNGLSIGLGPIAISVDQLVRSFPSVYQLLPTYTCLNIGDGILRELSDLDLPNISTSNLKEGLEFHARITTAIDKHPRYQTYVLKGVDQPTAQSALFRAGKVEVLRLYKGMDHGGDGTVPRPSSHPPEWESDVAGVFVPQTHAMLQSTDCVLTQLSGMLSGDLGKFLGGSRIGIDMPDAVRLGSSIPIAVKSLDGDAALPLELRCCSENGEEYGVPKIMRAAGDGRYYATIEGVPEGAWRVTVQSATPARPVEPVSDWTLVWNPAAA